ncbi:hypothetical protein Ahy_A03g016095 [Arachis hypogaea]|uniref:Aquaporin n=1 Tax=Arachis hypogaea TaxID=3818 RepID=A0A445E295_ARAHY|nr:hypothetical protein Ahy_A03g016095 [Arachis hypogaea]
MSTPTDPGGWRSCAACRFCFSSSLGRRSPLLSIRFAIFLVHLATVPIAGTVINPARSLGAAIIFNREHTWNDQIFDFLGWAFHWSCSCCRVPPDSHSILILFMLLLH